MAVTKQIREDVLALRASFLRNKANLVAALRAKGLPDSWLNGWEEKLDRLSVAVASEPDPSSPGEPAHKNTCARYNGKYGWKNGVACTCGAAGTTPALNTGMKQRHPKENPDVRCCWVCGRIGGSGFTSALRDFGYDVPRNVVAHAHERCIAGLQRQLAKKRRQLPSGRP